MKLRQFEKFENWVRKNYWSIFGMSESWFNKEDSVSSVKIQYEREEIQFMWEGWVASFRSNQK